MTVPGLLLCRLWVGNIPPEFDSSDKVKTLLQVGTNARNPATGCACFRLCMLCMMTRALCVAQRDGEVATVTMRLKNGGGSGPPTIALESFLEQ